MNNAILILILLSSPVFALNALSGNITIGNNGTSIFVGALTRDSMDISMAALNVARETDPKLSQHVLIDLDGYVIEPREDGGLFSINIPIKFDKFELKLIFPAETGFKEISSTIPYTKNKNMLTFNESQITSPQIDVIYQLNPQDKSEKNSKPNSSTLLLTILIPITFILFFQTWKKPKPITVKPEVLETLKFKEKQVVEAISSSGGTLSQARIRKKLGIPKSTLSNIVRDLEARKLVVRIENGNTYEIELDERIKN